MAQIDGAVHPELIPDTVAYRLYFIVVGQPPEKDAASKARQLAHLKGAGLSEEDISAAIDILADFKTEFDALVAAYNKTAEDAISHGMKPDYPTFKKHLDALVETTRLRLRSNLTVQSMNNLDAHLQGEKKRMKIDALEAQ